MVKRTKVISIRLRSQLHRVFGAKGQLNVSRYERTDADPAKYKVELIKSTEA